MAENVRLSLVIGFQVSEKVILSHCAKYAKSASTGQLITCMILLDYFDNTT